MPAAVSVTVSVTVPATTANIGPGFDCLGVALSLYNRFHFKLLETGLRIQVQGAEAHRVGRDRSNLAYRAFETLFQSIQRPVPGVQIDIELGVPLARGLGSSSTAIVGGLMGANQLAGEPLNTQAILDLAIALEGHPDNVAPALIGNCQLAAAADHGGWTLCAIPWHPEIIPVVAIPGFELSTEAARSVLPNHYSRADAIFNTAHLGLLLRALETGNPDWLREALGDRIHQPYRQSLIPGYAALREAALAAGAHGLVISGAGPTVLTLTRPENQQHLQEVLVNTWQSHGIDAVAYPLTVDTSGAQACVQPNLS